ncbi:unnamed protein product [Staurois parvus]|uniref:R-spondin Fu-CRD domain-containing protein n=1 Tax=Staurois parvus TaxID=386267 RepID=A0ABN9C5T6_9NEOB|nr:unnamed protein product [Staurois parvus]
MKQVGVCLSSCPNGYYGMRSPGINECKRCKADCETCFHKSFCTKCKGGFYLHSGKCLDTCPDGFENNNHSMECSTIVHCAVSEWSPWGSCTKRGKHVVSSGAMKQELVRYYSTLHHVAHLARQQMKQENA